MAGVTETCNFQVRKYHVDRMLIWTKKERSFPGRIPMELNNAAQTCWGIPGDQLSMTSPQDKQLACLPESHRLEARKCSISLSPKVDGPRRAVILSDSNYHIPTARMQSSSPH